MKIRQWLAKNWLTGLILVGSFLIANITLLTKPMFYTHDYLHGARIAEMARGLLEGQFPVIWSQNFGFGYGMPLFEFYAPLPYFVGALFYLVGCNLVVATKILFCLASLLTLLGTYWWARQWWRSETAALAAAMTCLASYRATDIFARGALSEIWGIAALPWLFGGITLIARRGWRGFPVTFAAGVVLVLSHNITTMIAAGILVGYAFLCVAATRQKERWHSLLVLSVTAIAIVGASAFYLLPAFFEKELTQVDTYILADYFNYRNHSLYIRQFWTDNFGYGGSGWGPDDGLSFFLGWAQWLGLALGVFLLIVGPDWRDRLRRCRAWLSRSQNLFKLAFFVGVSVFSVICFIWANKTSTALSASTGVDPLLSGGVLIGLAILLASVQWRLLHEDKQNKYYHQVFFIGVSILLLISLYMSLYKCGGVWETLEGVLAFTQFPWRFLAVAVPLVGVLAAGSTQLLPHRHQRLATIFLTAVLWITSAHYFQGDAYMEEPGYYQADVDYIRDEMSATLVDYLPKDWSGEWEAISADKVTVSEEQVEILVNRAHEKLYAFRSDASHEAEIALAAYPGWQAELDGVQAETGMSEHGNVTVRLPAGEVKLGLRLTATPWRRAGNAISLITWIVIIGMGVNEQWHKREF